MQMARMMFRTQMLDRLRQAVLNDMGSDRNTISSNPNVNFHMEEVSDPQRYTRVEDDFFDFPVLHLWFRATGKFDNGDPMTGPELRLSLLRSMDRGTIFETHNSDGSVDFGGKMKWPKTLNWNSFSYDLVVE